MKHPAQMMKGKKRPISRLKPMKKGALSRGGDSRFYVQLRCLSKREQLFCDGFNQDLDQIMSNVNHAKKSLSGSS